MSDKPATKSLSTKLELEWFGQLDRLARDLRKSRYSLAQRAIEIMLTQVGYVPEGVDRESLASFQELLRSAPGTPEELPGNSPRQPSRNSQGTPEELPGNSLGTPEPPSLSFKKEEEERKGRSRITKRQAEAIGSGAKPLPAWPIDPVLYADLTHACDRADDGWLRVRLVGLRSEEGTPTPKQRKWLRQGFLYLAEYGGAPLPQPNLAIAGKHSAEEQAAHIRRLFEEGKLKPIVPRPSQDQLGPSPVRPFPGERVDGGAS